MNRLLLISLSILWGIPYFVFFVYSWNEYPKSKFIESGVGEHVVYIKIPVFDLYVAQGRLFQGMGMISALLMVGCVCFILMGVCPSRFQGSDNNIKDGMKGQEEGVGMSGVFYDLRGNAVKSLEDENK